MCIEGPVDWSSDLEGGFEIEPLYPRAKMCGYFLNATTGNPIMMSGYVNDSTQAGVLGEALLTRTLPLTTVLTKEPLYGNGSINFKHLRNTIMDVLIVAASDGTADSVYSLEPPLAHECVLSWCVKTLNSKYDWGRYIEDTVSVVYNTTPGQFPWTSEFVSTPEENYTNIFYTQDISIEIEEGDPFRSKFGTSNGTVSAILQGFTDIFPSFTTTFENATSPPVLRYKTWSTGPAWHRYLDYNPWLQSNITTHMEKLARAMTNQVRSSANKEMVPGNSYDKETWIFVSWQWLAFPWTLFVLTSMFLISTMIKTSKDDAGAGMWKTSAMPTLIYGLPKETQDKIVPSRWDKKTKKIRIKLSPKMGWRVSGQSFRQPSPMLPVQRAGAPPGWI